MKLDASRPGDDHNDMVALWPLSDFADPEDAIARLHGAYPLEEPDPYPRGLRPQDRGRGPASAPRLTRRRPWPRPSCIEMADRRALHLANRPRANVPVTAPGLSVGVGVRDIIDLGVDVEEEATDRMTGNFDVSAAPSSAVDLSTGESFHDGFPHEFFTWLRANDPVHWHEPTAKSPDGEGFWVVSRHADVMTVFRDPVTFSSDRGDGQRELGGTGIKDERSAGSMLNMTDDPQHHRLRSLVNRGFTPRAVSALEEELRRRTRLLLDAVGDEPFDAVHGFARELPAQAICIVLGIPEDDRRDLLDWLDAGIEADSASIVSAEATTLIRGYAAGLIADKRAHPDDGIMSTIVNARLDAGEALTDRELTAFFALLFPAGAETTRNAISGGIKAFIDHPDQYARLAADPALLATAVDEIVRWTTPSVYKRRTASHATALGATTIRPGDKVTVWEMSANRDELVFDEPFTFDVGRQPNPHVGFGFGVHYCLGASLARLELRVALEELRHRFDGFEAAGPHRWTPNNRLFGLKHLPVLGRPARPQTPA